MPLLGKGNYVTHCNTWRGGHASHCRSCRTEWLVKAERETQAAVWLGRIVMPTIWLGRRVRLKVELVED